MSWMTEYWIYELIILITNSYLLIILITNSYSLITSKHLITCNPSIELNSINNPYLFFLWGNNNYNNIIIVIKIIAS